MLDFILAFAGFGLLFHVQASFWESLFHEHILDLTPERRVRFHRLKGVWPRLWATHFDHGVLHHYRTYRASYVERFRDGGEEARLQDRLRRQFPRHLAEAFTRTRYGSTYTWLGLLPFAIPLWLNLLWLAALPSGAAMAGCLMANLVFSTPYLVFSKWVHPYMHMRFADAMQQAPGLLRRILGSPYGVAVRVSHYVHHEDPRVNYNLQYLADRLRGRWRAPTPGEWDDMIALGLVEPHHRTRLEGRTFLGHPF